MSDPATVLFCVFGALLLLGAPIAIALGMAAMGAFMVVGQDLTTLVQIAFNSVNSFPIMALPSFVLAGALMECAGISRRLVNIAEAMTGQISGGLAISTTLACVFFGAISGSGPATTAAIGMLMIPAMIRSNYSPSFAGAVTATAGGIGIIIPPSIPMVIYGVTAQVSITKMFIAGLVPGFLIAVALMLTHYLKCRNKGLIAAPEVLKELSLSKALREGVWAVFAPLIILGGIYSGKFTPTESAVVAIFYTLFVGTFIYRDMSFKGLMLSLKTCSWLTGRVLIIMFTAYSFGRLLVQYRIPDMIASGILDLTDSPLFIWALIVVFLLFLGMFMETLAIIMLVTPVLLPVVLALGGDPIHFGIILICCCAVGFSTPPLGENLFIASGVAGVSLEELSAKALPYCLVIIAVIVVLIAVPKLVLFLPALFGY